MAEKRVLAFGVLLLVDMIVSIVMLATDKNLQTDFGSVAPYYLHWYGVLAMTVVDLLIGVALLAYAVVPMMRKMSVGARRGVVIGALAWTVIAIVIMLGIVTSYSQVGFSSEHQFAQYLFGVTAYPGALSYIPWLFDFLLGTYVVTAIVGALALRRGPSAAPASAPS